MFTVLWTEFCFYCVLDLVLCLLRSGLSSVFTVFWAYFYVYCVLGVVLCLLCFGHSSVFICSGHSLFTLLWT